jgi:hypothetical protein
MWVDPEGDGAIISPPHHRRCTSATLREDASASVESFALPE